MLAHSQEAKLFLPYLILTMSGYCCDGDLLLFCLVYTTIFATFLKHGVFLGITKNFEIQNGGSKIEDLNLTKSSPYDVTSK